RYHAASAFGSALLKNMPPIAVIRAIVRPQVCPSATGEEQHQHDDDDRHELRRDAVAHQPVGPGGGDVAALPERVEAGAQDAEDDENRDADDEAAAHAGCTGGVAGAGAACGTAGPGTQPDAFLARSRNLDEIWSRRAVHSGFGTWPSISLK